MLNYRTVFRLFIFCTAVVLASALLCGCMFLPFANLLSGEKDLYENTDPIVGTWSYSHAYDTSLNMTTKRYDSYFMEMTFHADGTAILLMDLGTSYLEPSEIQGDWELIEDLDSGRVYNINWYTENTSPSFELFYLESDDGSGDTVCAWPVQFPADEDV